MKRSKHNHESSEDDQSDSDTKVERKTKKKHKKHSKHKSHHKEKVKKEELESSSSESEQDVQIVVKKSKHKSSSSENSESEQERKSHHKKKKKKSKHGTNDDVETEVKIEPEDREEKTRHHHKHRHHHRHERHGQSSRPEEEGERHRHSGRHDRESKRSRENESSVENRGQERTNRTHNGDSTKDSRDSDNRSSKWSRDDDGSSKRSNDSQDRLHQSGSSQQRDRKPKKPFCDDAAEEYEWGRKDGKSGDATSVQQPKQKPDFGLSGKLTEDTNMYNGVVIKYSEPPDARKPKRRWRLYPFKEDTQLPVLHIHRQSAFLMGRDRKVADIPVDHPSCSKQHAALQYRLTDYTRDDGSKGKRIRLYIIDLESANGTFVNNKKIEAKRYVELLEKDVIKFGFSSREYVLLHEHSKDSDLDDDVVDEA